ncbi:hypothetical protein S7S_14985 [Isoalcanivorax pacificus W11-5]|uniref:Lipoprotein n=1 Tax=Isoalcanivorax pacificus W11-5 TaxID=391936 RepID=A0A0B4XM87_9GAMM|nr:hypothetical protein [Isoalcanivorax pacificus]AJD49409.1 hypothetical protein S7S_14985 [Isoalcanivorax pacificus W11-5]
MNATTHALTRFTPLALCLALAACGGGSSDGGQLGTIDPIPLPLDEDYAPVAARLAVSYPEVIADTYNDLFALVDDIRNECDEFLTETDLGDGAFSLKVENCAVAPPSPPMTYHERNTNLLLTYVSEAPATQTYDISTFEDDVLDIAGGFRTVQQTRADGSLTATSGTDGLALTNTNASVTQRVEVYDAVSNTLLESQSGLHYFHLQNYDLNFEVTPTATSAEQTGRLTVFVGAIEAYIDIETDTALEQDIGEDCPHAGQVLVTGSNDDDMSIHFSGTDVLVMINGADLEYPITCEEFIEWTAEE